jgi:hypothetical protein
MPERSKFSPAPQFKNVAAPAVKIDARQYLKNSRRPDALDAVSVAGVAT